MTKEQWVALKNCDRKFDGQFYYTVKGSKKVCRPSCPKRSYDPKKMMIFDRLEDALDAGYQPCGRCRPDLPDWAGAKAELSRGAERFIREHSTEKFSLSALAAALHVDKFYLLRTFKNATGFTPLEFHNSVRCESAKELLTRPELSISYISSAVGYASASHFTQVFRKIVGCTPSEYRNTFFKTLDA